ncbi:MAG: 3'(2'),5'-bisphosphate nucleotidase CysQ, partial [Sandaracinaceae bacterium]
MLDRELVEAVKLAREAGAILMEVYATDFDVEYKGEQNPVTVADRRANEHLVSRLREAFPHDGVVAEETADTSDALRRGRCWYIDPLDGTKEFIKKNGEFSVMIGLAIDGEARLGVVYKPVDDTLYRGVVGDSAFREVGAKTYALGVTKTSVKEELRLVVSRSHRSEATGEFVDKVGIQNETKSGSVGLKVGLIAQRDADLYLHLSEHSWAWDACAPEAILRAAGGRFTDLAGDAFEYGGEDLRNSRGILACNNEETFQAVLPAAREVATGLGLVTASESSDAGSSDAEPSDAEPSDAGSSDAGSSDAGSSDAGSSDAGSSDAGSSDAGSSDAG